MHTLITDTPGAGGLLSAPPSATRPSLPGSLVLLVLLLAGCQAARISVPESLTTATPLHVEGRQGWKVREQLRFGPYETVALARSWTKGSDLQVLVVSGNRRKQRYAFTLREAGRDRWQVACEAAVRRGTVHTPLVDVEWDNRSALDCLLRALDGPDETWQMTLSERDEHPLQGRLVHGRTELEVRGTRKLDKALAAQTTTGYHVSHAGQVVGAVEVINDGTVWLHPEMPAERRHLLSAAAAALLVLEDLRGHLPDAPATS